MQCYLTAQHTYNNIRVVVEAHATALNGTGTLLSNHVAGSNLE